MLAKPGQLLASARYALRSSVTGGWCSTTRITYAIEWSSVWMCADFAIFELEDFVQEGGAGGDDVARLAESVGLTLQLAAHEADVAAG